MASALASRADLDKSQAALACRQTFVWTIAHSAKARVRQLVLYSTNARLRTKAKING